MFRPECNTDGSSIMFNIEQREIRELESACMPAPKFMRMCTSPETAIPRDVCIPLSCDSEPHSRSRGRTHIGAHGHHDGIVSINDAAAAAAAGYDGHQISFSASSSANAHASSPPANAHVASSALAALRSTSCDFWRLATHE